MNLLRRNSRPKEGKENAPSQLPKPASDAKPKLGLRQQRVQIVVESLSLKDVCLLLCLLQGSPGLTDSARLQDLLRCIGDARCIN